MEKVRGSEAKALAGKLLGCDEEARELKRKVDEMHHELNESGQLRDTIKLILEHFRCNIIKCLKSC